jgi:stage II sporulation protein D
MAGRIPTHVALLIGGFLPTILFAGLPALAGGHPLTANRPQPQSERTIPVLLGGLGGGERLLVTGGREQAAGNGGTPASGPLDLSAEGNVVVVRRGPDAARRLQRLPIVPMGGRMTIGTELPGREVRVPVAIRAREGRLVVVAQIPEARYIAGVVDGEMTPSAAHQALRAQAIVARSFLYQSRRRHQADDAWVCDQSHCQVWHQHADPHIAAAVSDTAGLVVVGPAGKPVPIYYHASCGGSTVPVHVVYGGPPQPHLGGVPDPGCQADAGWQATVSLPQGVAALRQAKLIGPASVTTLTVGDRTASGWPVSVTAGGVAPRTVSAYQAWLAFGQAWGWGRLPGLHFDLTQSGDTLTFHGRGIGHGIGLCQRGTMRQARQGRTAEAILATYFPGTTVGQP